ncbi:MAG: hypothetical protein CVV07_07365 [Gammaproteobacteria bacterium HGW-Gammaproteobacteria-11]|nr:MAG: hypothetical protein CVV07_07365 [Gammaproteobacteria bacterium HGW-Gammaproteobacteria-11]
MCRGSHAHWTTRHPRRPPATDPRPAAPDSGLAVGGDSGAGGAGGGAAGVAGCGAGDGAGLVG